MTNQSVSIRHQSPAGFGNQGRAKIMITPETGVKFENVAGIDEAIQLGRLQRSWVSWVKLFEILQGQQKRHKKRHDANKRIGSWQFISISSLSMVSITQFRLVKSFENTRPTRPGCILFSLGGHMNVLQEFTPQVTKNINKPLGKTMKHPTSKKKEPYDV